MPIMINPASFYTYACTHTTRTHTYIKEAGACDVATDVISTHSYAHWQNVKTDSGAAG